MHLVSGSVETGARGRSADFRVRSNPRHIEGLEGSEAASEFGPSCGLESPRSEPVASACNLSRPILIWGCHVKVVGAVAPRFTPPPAIFIVGLYFKSRRRGGCSAPGAPATTT